MRLLLILTSFCAFNLSAQTLNLPARNPAALNGDQVISAITSLNLVDRENYILNEALNGNVPDFLRTMVNVQDSALIGGNYKHISYFCIPDYMALGTDTNYYLCPMTPILAQRMADSLDCILPSRKMVNQIWKAATVKMQPESIPPSADMITVPIMADHNDMVWTQRQTFFPGLPLGEGVSGDKKDVVISNLIYSSPPPNRVVIYGWHYPNGSNIQPLYAGHIDTYADYSHGIRMVQNAAFMDGNPVLLTDVLTSATNYSLLSDEGVIAQPYYPDTSAAAPSIPATPSTFAVVLDDATSLRVKIQYNPNVDSYLLQTSNDGLSFSAAGSFNTNDFVVNGLTTNQITYIRLAAQNTSGTSAYSEVLGGVPTLSNHIPIIINGFDRLSTGNSKDFIRQHGQAIKNYGYGFSSATNEAMANGIVDLQSYEIVDYILGEESTIDETFNTTEQNKVKTFLQNGGYLFVSGAEIGWDLDHLGTAADKEFYNQYLKASYNLDAPNDESATYYEFDALPSTIFSNSSSVSFDDGTHGTYNVDYPDVLNAVNGGVAGLEYTGLTNNIAGVYYKGVFPSSLDTGKVVNLGFPFETVYDEMERFNLMTDVLDFFMFAPVSTAATDELINEKLKVFPNPAEEVLNIVSKDKLLLNSQIILMDVSGKELMSIIGEKKNHIDVSKLDAGVYVLKIIDDSGELLLIQRVVKK